jgi:hypothetical protein
MLRDCSLPLSESIHPTAVRNFLDLLGHSQLIEILAQARALGAMLPWKGIVAFNPPQQLAGDRLAIGMDISLLSGEHMPDRHQEFTGDRDHRLLLTQASTQSLKERLPIRMVFERDPGGLNHHEPQVTAALLGTA